MKKYYVNDHAQDSGDHEVHVETCSFLHLIERKTYLGQFYSCHGAVEAAKKIYPTADGCAFCSPDCNNG